MSIIAQFLTIDAKPLAKPICDNPEDPRYHLFCGEISTETSSTQFHNFGSGVGTQIGFNGSTFGNQNSQVSEQGSFSEWIKTSTISPSVNKNNGLNYLYLKYLKII